MGSQAAPETGGDVLTMEFHVSYDLFRSPHAERDDDDTGMPVSVSGGDLRRFDVMGSSAGQVRGRALRTLDDAVIAPGHG